MILHSCVKKELSRCKQLIRIAKTQYMDWTSVHTANLKNSSVKLA